MEEEIVDPLVLQQQIKFKLPWISNPIDYLSIGNAVLALLSFCIRQFHIFGTSAKTQVPPKEKEAYTFGTLASALPAPEQPPAEHSKKEQLNFYLSPMFDLLQLKNFSLIVLTVVGVFDQDRAYPAILLFLLLTELEVFRVLGRVLLNRIWHLLAVFVLIVLLCFFTAYIKFWRFDCDDLESCFYEQILLLSHS